MKVFALQTDLESTSEKFVRKLIDLQESSGFNREEKLFEAAFDKKI